MSGVLRQSTASQVIELGPFLDDTDFKTPETGLTIANTDIKIRKGGGTTHGNKNSGGATAIANGYYHATLDATDTDTVGILDVHVNVSGALAVFDRFLVVEEAVFDALFAAAATGALPVSSGGIAAAAFAAGAINAAAIATDAIDADALAADAIAEINATVDTAISDAALATAAALATVDTNVDTLLTRITATLFAGITSLAEWLGLLAGKQVGNTTARTELRATGAGTGTYDETTDSQEAIRDNMGTAQTGDSFARLGAPAGASVSVDIAAVKASVDTIDGLVDAILEDTGTTLPATLTTIAGYLDTEIQAILDDTNELQTDWANGGRLDLLLDAVKAITDQFVFTTPGQVDATAVTVADKTGYAIGTGGIPATAFGAGAIDAGALATDAVTEIVTAVFARAFSAGYNSLTFDQITKVIVAAVAGKANGLETTSVNYRNLADTANVIAATVDADGNRTAVTLNP